MITVSADKIILNQKELKARLGGMPSEEIDHLLQECEKAVFSALDCKYYYCETTVKTVPDGCDLGFGLIKSKNLQTNLVNCQKAYVFAGTLGHGVDRLLHSTGLISPLKQFIIDAVASTAIEALCDLVQENLPKATKARFSAGYGDFDISYQQKILDFLGAPKNIGITLSNSCLMNPTKSVTAIMGIKE